MHPDIIETIIKIKDTIGCNVVTNAPAKVLTCKIVIELSFIYDAPMASK
jgi:hypothetical protein